MPRTKLGYYAASPLARHPALLLRKIRDRVIGPARFVFGDAPASVRARYPESLVSGLRAWAAACDLHDRPFSSHRVFRQDFQREELLQLCRTGPLPRKDLRGDVKLIWEFSRGYAHTLNAARGLADAGVIAGEIKDWICHNNDTNGPNWTNPMEIAIRAVNWISADALTDGKISAAVGPVLWTSNLWNSGRAIFQRLEARLVCSNHYLADLLGLLFIGTVLGRSDWRKFAVREFPRALQTQTHGDGGVYEASLPYHALVTEMALLFSLVAGATPPRLPLMCQVLADAMDVGGDVFQVGDNDGGRMIPLDFVSRNLGRAQILLKLARIVLRRSFSAQDTALYPESGWWIARRGDWTVLFEFGGVGMAGLGGHAHNDDLSVCVNWKNQRVLVDPGSYLYTPDPDARDRYRSVASHNTVAPAGCEPRVLPKGARHELFSLPGSMRAARTVAAAPDDIEMNIDWITSRFQHERRVAISSRGVTIRDKHSDSDVPATWRFHTAPGVPVESQHLHARIGGVELKGDLPLRTEPYFYSPFYGSQESAAVLVGDGRATSSAGVTWRLSAL